MFGSTTGERIRVCAAMAARIAQRSINEQCGFVYPHAVIGIINVSPSPEHEYMMDSREQVDAMTEYGWPEAVWHTHPGGTAEPSKLDIDTALPNVPMVIGWPGGGGVWLNGQQTMEVTVSNTTNDIGEVYEDGAGEWRWRRVAPNHAVIASSNESFANHNNAARALYRANPDLAPEPQRTEGPTSDADAVGTAGGGATAGPVTGAPGTGAGGNSYGVGPTTTTP